MKSYRVQSPLKHDGKLHAPGDLVELSDDQAAPLVAKGRVKPTKGSAKKPDGG